MAPWEAKILFSVAPILRDFLGSCEIRLHGGIGIPREAKPQGRFLKEAATTHAEAANTRFTTSSDH